MDIFQILLQHLFLGFITCVIGALPFGLVNLSVLKRAVDKRKKTAIAISHGASVTEIAFAAIAVFFGSFLKDALLENLYLNLFIVLVLLTASFIYFFKKSRGNKATDIHLKGIMKGIILNLISLQVLLYWILALGFLITQLEINYQPVFLIIFFVGVWIGKMTTLRLYIEFSRIIEKRSYHISNYINKVIGGLLLLVATFQIFKVLL